jgi:hypothetical protein
MPEAMDLEPIQVQRQTIQLEVLCEKTWKQKYRIRLETTRQLVLFSLLLSGSICFWDCQTKPPVTAGSICLHYLVFEIAIFNLNKIFAFS